MRTASAAKAVPADLGCTALAPAAAESTRRAAILTLGCRLNQADSALVAAALTAHGYRVVPWDEPAEVRVIASCAVTGRAAQKTRQALRAARRAAPHAIIAVIGCGVDLDPVRWGREPDVDLVLPNAAKLDLARLLPVCRPERAGAVRVGNAAVAEPLDDGFRLARTGEFVERTRAYLKIQDGCDFRCSYCVVPRARGAARSRDWDDVLREARELAVRGFRELVLTGVNIATYRAGTRDLADLVAALLAGPGEFRLRLGSTEPGPVIERLLPLVRDNRRVCRFLHLPMQYGEDGVLRGMNRRHTVAEFTALAETAAAAIPGLCLGTDVIVGFPGENETAFEQCCATVARLPLALLHVFTYSPRPGTPAATLPDRVPTALARQRYQRLRRIGLEKAQAFAGRHVGQTLEVLTEAVNARGNVEGWSDNYLRVELLDRPAPALNRLVTVRIEAVASAARGLRGALSVRQTSP